MLPDWYWDGVAIPQRRSRGRSGLAVRRALGGLAKALAIEFSSAERGTSRLSRIEPRAKIAGILLLIFGATFIHGLTPLAAMLGAAAALALSCRLGPKRLAPIWLGVPLFGLAVVLPATTNWVSPGDAALSLWRPGPGAQLGLWQLPETLTVTYPGLVVAARLLLRSLTCVTLAFLLVATTDREGLLSGLRGLGVPRAFGMVLSMTQRYLGILLRSAEEIHLAKLSRTISAGPLRSEQRWVAAGIGMLFRRTHKLAQEVHLAMISRGYDGELH